MAAATANQTHYFDPVEITGTPPPTAGIEAERLDAALSAPPLVSAPAEDRGGAYEGLLDVPGSLTRPTYEPPAARRRRSPRPMPLAAAPTPDGEATVARSEADIAARKAAEEAQRWRELADKIGLASQVSGPGTARMMLDLLAEWDPNDSGLVRLQVDLRNHGLLEGFFDYARHEDVWAEMRRRGVSEVDLLENMSRFGTMAATGFMLGVAAGIGVEFVMIPVGVYDALTAVGGSVWNGTLRKDAVALTSAIGRLLSNPAVIDKLSQKWVEEFMVHLARRQWEAAGMMLGQAGSMIVDVAGAAALAAKAPKIIAGASKELAKAGAKLAADLPAYALSLFLRTATPTDLRAWRSLYSGDAKVVKLSTGSAEAVGDTVIVKNIDGVPEAKLALDDQSLKETLEMVDKRFADLEMNGTGDLISAAVSPTDALLLKADEIAGIVRSLVADTGNARTTGTLRDTEFIRQIDNWAAANAPSVKVYPREMRNMPGFDPNIASMTINEFLDVNRGLRDMFTGPKGGDWLRDVNLDGLVGDLKVDLYAVDPPTGQALLFDLTANPGTLEHLAKGKLYEKILTQAMPAIRTRIAEGYHAPASLPKPPYKGP